LLLGQQNGHVSLQVRSISTYFQFVSVQIKLPICILLLVKQLVRSKEQLVPAYIPILPGKRQVRSKEQFVPILCFVISQTTSSIQRTVCTFPPDVVMIQRQVRSKEQSVSTLLSISPAKRPVRSKEQFVPVYLSVSSIKCQVRSKEQLVSAYMSMFPVKCQVRSQEQLVPASCFVFLGQVASSIQRTACTLFSIPWFVYPVNVHLNPQ
jgi:hypothetical protein